MSQANVLQAAKDELRLIDSQLTALSTRRSRLQDFIATYQSLLGGTPTGRYGEQEDEAAATRPALDSAPKTAKAKILSAVTAILRQGQPKTTKQLVSELDSQGVHIGGADKAANLAAILSREKRLFHNVRGLGYSLAEASSQKDEAAGG